MKKNIAGIAVFGLVTMAALLGGAEMPRSLRKAEKLYQNSKYSEAAKEALDFYQTSPNNLQCIIILGMSNFYLNNYRSSKKWFNKANQLSKNHPITAKYLELLKELEYRSGPFSIEPSEAETGDPAVTHKELKKGYFNTISSIPSSPFLSHSAIPLPPPSSFLPPLLSSPSPAPSSKSLLTLNYMEKMAREAFEAKKYEKAYLFYSQLAAAKPKNYKYAVSKAEAAYQLRRYSTVLDILLPLSSKNSIESMETADQTRLKLLLDASANKKFIPGK